MLRELLVSSIQFFCLSEAIYFEARSESYAEQIKVGAVIHNRSIDPSSRWGETYCSVVEHPMQFSYLNGVSGVGSVPMQDQDALDNVMRAAYAIYTLEDRPYLDNILYYHRDYMLPNWDFTKIEREEHLDGVHYFYSDR